MNPAPNVIPAAHGEVYVELYPASPVFPATVDHDRVEGWARPHFRLPVAAAVLGWLHDQHERGESGSGTGYFDGAGIVLIDPAGNRSAIPADDQGRVAWSAGWRWLISSPATDPTVDAELLADTDRLTPQPGEVLVTIDVDQDAPAFPAIVQRSWNGWACPLFRRPVAEAVVAWTSDLCRKYPDGSWERLYWEGDSVVHVHSDNVDEDGYLPYRVEPDADGRYAIGTDGWTWSTV